MVVKSGGGSVVYGSGAIGGSVHLNNRWAYGRGARVSLYSEAASYGTFHQALKTSFSDERLSVQFNLDHRQSENDYEVPKKRYVNRNGQYANHSVDLGAAYRLNEKHQLYWQTQFFDGTQHYPIFSVSQTKTKYEAQTTRSLLTWSIERPRFHNNLRLAYMEENFGYYGEVSRPKSSGGKAMVHLVKNDFEYRLGQGLKFSAIGEFQYQKAEGMGSGIGRPTRSLGSLTVLLQGDSNRRFYWEMGSKREKTQGYGGVQLYSLAGNYRFSEGYTVKWSASKNFRVPTFNDLFWQPGGNTGLRPETSYQAEMSHVFERWGMRWSITPYYNRIENMIRWLPSSAGYWTPLNTDQVEIMGLESRGSYRKAFNGGRRLLVDLGYTYNRSVNRTTGRQLMYVPMHHAFGKLGYDHSGFGVYLQGLFNGLTYTTSDESLSKAIDPYFVVNAGAYVVVFKKQKIGMRVNNLGNTVYETVAYYPLPLRNYSVFLTLNF